MTTVDNVMEMAAGGWQDITADVLFRRGIDVQRGRPDEQATSIRSSCRFTLNNTSGNYTALNPMGAHYASLGPNTPFRWGRRMARDQFARTSVDSWGTSTSGHAWSTFGSGGVVANSNYQVAANQGTHLVPAANAYRYTYQADVSYEDIDVAVTCTIDGATLNVAGGAVEPANLLLRGQSTTSYYMVRLSVSTAEALSVDFHNGAAGGSLTSGPTTITSFTYDSAVAIRVRAQVEGWTLRVKVWPASEDEPVAWDKEHTDETAAITGPGWVGVRSGAAASNSNVPLTFEYTDWQVISRRVCGELGAIPPQADTSGSYRTADVTGVGMLQRLSLGDSVLQSAPRRYIPTSDPAVAAYWPLEEGPLSTAGAPVVGEHQLTVNSTAATSELFGRGTLAPWLPNGATLKGGDEMLGVVDMPSTTTDWAVDLLVRCQLTTDWQIAVWTLDGSLWLVRWIPSSNSVAVTWPGGSFTYAITQTIWDGAAHHIRFVADQQGADTAFYVDIDGSNTAAVGLLAGLTNSPIVQVGIGDLTEHTEEWGFSHLVVYGQTRPLAEYTFPVLGYVGETAGRRMQRLLGEEGVPFYYIGDLDETPMMGPQGPDKLVTMITQCQAADDGELFESRYTHGLVYRTRASMYNQTAVASLNYADSDPSTVEPAYDDQATRNDITAVRTYGGTYRAEQTTGPLSVSPPWEGGAGRRPVQLPLLLQSDDQLPARATWALRRGTVNDYRYPQIGVELQRGRFTTDNPAGQRALLDAEIGRRVTVDDATTLGIYDQISQLVSSIRERADGFTHTLDFTCVPAAPFAVEEVSTGWLDTDGSTLITALSDASPGAGDTLAVTHGTNAPWSTTGGHYPRAITVNGEEMTATAVADELMSAVVAGAVAHADNAAVTPGLPAGWAADDALYAIGACRNFNAGLSINQGYVELFNMGNLRLFGKIATSSESAPTITPLGSAAGDTVTGVVFKVTGKFGSIANTVVAKDWVINGVAQQNIPYPGLEVPRANCMVMVIGWKQDDWTSVATLAGMTELVDVSSTLGNDHGLVVDYVIQTTRTPVTSGSFTVTGGTSQFSIGATIALRCDRQTFTVERGANGVHKAHAAASPVLIPDPLVVTL